MKKKYKNLFLSGIAMFFYMHPLFAQAPDTLWTRTYNLANAERGWSVQQTTDGGYIVVGETSESGGWLDICFIKTDSNGDTLWVKVYGGDSSDTGYSVQQTFDKGYIIAGWTDFGVASVGDIYLIKTDSLGDTLWTEVYGGVRNDVGCSVQQTSDSGYVVTGRTNSFGAGHFDIGLLKVDANGGVLWWKTYGGIDDDRGESVQKTSDGGFIIAGETKSFGAGDYDVYLIKTDSIGDTIWTNVYGGEWDDLGRSVQQTSDGGYVVAGTIDRSTSDDDVYVIKTDSLGDTLWTRIFGGPLDDYGWCIRLIPDDGYIIAGSANHIGWLSGDIYLIKIDANGDTLWTNVYLAANHSRGYSVQVTPDGCYVITGEIFSGGLSDVYLIKTEPDVGIYGNQIINPGIQTTFVEIYPNPFNEETDIRYQMMDKNNIRMEIYDAVGRSVKLFDDKTIQLSDHVIWDGRDNSNQQLPIGVYFLTLAVRPGGESRNYRVTKKLLMLK